MELVQTFILALFFSFLGSLPPGSINLNILQLSLSGNRKGAVLFGIAASSVEFLYSFLAVKFQLCLSGQIYLNFSFKLISSVALILIGAGNIRMIKKEKDSTSTKTGNSFKKGIIISLLNPLAIPFWIACTLFLQNNNLIFLTNNSIFVYITGIACGSLFLHLLIAFLAFQFSPLFSKGIPIHKIIGAVFLILGLSGLAGSIKELL